MSHRALRVEEEPAWNVDERLSLMIESVHDYAIFMLDPAGNVMSWNAGAQRIKGYLPAEILGKHFSVFYRPGDAEAGKCDVALRIAAQAGSVEEEGYRVRKDGSQFWAGVTLSAMRDSRGRLVGYAKVTRDLSERRQVEERLRQGEDRFRLLVESVKDHAMFLLDAVGNVTTWNAGAERLFGYTTGEVTGLHFSRFYGKDEVRSDACQGDLDSASQQARFETEGFRVRKDGSRFWAKVQLSRLSDRTGALIGFAHIAQDLTGARLAEEGRVRLAQAREAIRLRDEFLSIASHELKTPLTALQLQLQTLARSLESSERSRHKMDRAVHAARRLANLVDELLDVSRISTGRLNLTPERVDLAEVVRGVVDQFSEAAARAGCVIDVEAPEPVVGNWDKLRMEQVLGNLLCNALKYGAGAPVGVAVWSEGRAAVMEVTDEGPGIPKDDLIRIFERFERAHSMRKYGGLGLGLYLARQIAEAHGGTVTARNISGHGACLTVRVPVSSPTLTLG